MESAPSVSRFATWRHKPAPWFIALLVLCAVHVGINAWWLTMDHHVIRGDEEVHMQFARDYYQVFSLNTYANPVEMLVGMAQIAPRNPAHPPLLHVLGGGMLSLLGYSMDTIAFTSSLLFVIGLMGCWLLARRFLPPSQAFFAVVVTSLTPILFAGSRIFMTDYLSMVIVVWALYALIRSEGFHLTGWVFFFAVLNGLGISTRSVTFLYYLVPAGAIFVLGAWRLFSFREGMRFDRGGAGRLVLNAVMTIVVTVGIAAPWYLRHIDTVYDFWANKHAGGGSPLAIMDLGDEAVEEAPDAGEVSTTPPTTAPPVALEMPGEPAPPAAGVGATVSWWETAIQHPQVQRLVHPNIPWWRYLQDINNDLMFMPLTVLALFGMLAGLLVGRFRSPTYWVLLLSVLSTYVAMTVVFKYSTPRYVMQVVPALALFAALAVLALPRGRVRAAGCALLLAWLVFQFVNLSITPMGAVARAEFRIDDKLAVVYKDILTPSSAFSRLSAPIEDNYKDRMFAAMCDVEASRRNMARGEFANFVVLGFRGLEFEQKHYWPDPNPFLRRDLSVEQRPGRKFRQIALNRHSFKAVEPYLNKADYVVYAVRPEQPEKEAIWRERLAAAGFQEVDHFQYEGFGLVPTRNYAVYAHEHVGETREISTTEDLDELSALDLYYLRRSPNFNVLAPALRAYAEKRYFDEMEKAYPGTGYPMSQAVSLMSAGREPLGNGVWEFILVFKVNEAIPADYRMYFHGMVAESDYDKLPEEKREQGYIDWNFNPSPPTSEWPANDYMVIRHTIEAPPLTYRIRFGLFEKVTEQFQGRPAQLDWMDLSGH